MPWFAPTQTFSYDLAMHMRLPILILSLLLAWSCADTSPSTSTCDGVDCHEVETPIKPGLTALENAPFGLPCPWIRPGGDLGIIVASSEGIHQGIGSSPQNLVWSDLLLFDTPQTPTSSPTVTEDKEGRIHVLYESNGDLRYWTNAPTGTSESLVAEGVGKKPRPSIDIDQNGKLHATFFSETDSKLLYASRGSSQTWTPEIVPLPQGPCEESEDCSSETLYGTHSDLKMQQGSPVVVFYDESGGNLCLSTRVNGTWVGQIIDGEDNTLATNTGNVGKWPSMFVDTKGNLAIAYHGVTGTDLRFAAPSAGQISKQQVDPGIIEHETGALIDTSMGAFAQLLTSPAGQPVLFYLDSDAPGVRRAERKGDIWTLSTLPLEHPGGFHLNAASDGKGTCFVVFQSWIAPKEPNGTIERRMTAWFEPLP